MTRIAVGLRLSGFHVALFLLSCACTRDDSSAPAPSSAALPEAVRSADAASAVAPRAVAGDAQAPATARIAASGPVHPYRGSHRLGVNRVTDMARTGTVTFEERDGSLSVEGRVARGPHWLALRGRVESRGAQAFDLVGTIEGVPDMKWAGEALRARRTEGRFRFEVRKGRPYFRLYQVNGRECVCHDRCGNDFCYIDVEVAETAP
jgi:hypothetical protein